VISYVRNLVIIFVGFYVVQQFFGGLLTGTDSATTLIKTLVPTMIAIGGAIYAVVGAMSLTKTGGAD